MSKNKPASLADPMYDGHNERVIKSFKELPKEAQEGELFYIETARAHTIYRHGQWAYYGNNPGDAKKIYMGLFVRQYIKPSTKRTDTVSDFSAQIEYNKLVCDKGYEFIPSTKFNDLLEKEMAEQFGLTGADDRPVYQYLYAILKSYSSDKS